MSDSKCNATINVFPSFSYSALFTTAVIDRLIVQGHFCPKLLLISNPEIH